MSRPLVVGVGQRWRGDDAVGPLLVEVLRERLGEVADFLVIEGDPLELLEHWEGRSRVVIIDAYEASGRRREVRHWCLSAQTSVTAQNLPFVTGGFSSHLVGLPEALKLGEALGRNPTEIHLIGIPGRDFGLAPVHVKPARGVPSALETEVTQLVASILAQGNGREV